jgi:hypothetical protein
MAISIAGTDSFAGGKATGTQTSDRTVPSHDGIAYISFHYFLNTTDAVTSVTLGGTSATKIADVVDVGHNHTAVWWVAGVAAGTRTLAWDNTNTMLNMAVTVIYLSSSETGTPIRASGTDFDTNGGSGVTGLTFTAGDWTMISYTSDQAGVWDGTTAANTAAITEAVIDSLYVGVSYRTDGGDIDVDDITASYTGIVAATVKAVAGTGTITPTAGTGSLTGQAGRMDHGLITQTMVRLS